MTMLSDDELQMIRERYRNATARLGSCDYSDLQACVQDIPALLAHINMLREEKERLVVELVGAVEIMEYLLAGKPGGVYFQKYQGGLQIALRSARHALKASTAIP